MELKHAAQQRFLAVEHDLRKLSRWMYDNPEIAFEERETSARLVRFLEDAGFHVEYPAYGLETAFAARVGRDGPEVVICCEMDALPEVGHACGHNIIAMAAMGAGLAVASSVDDLGIRITVLGTPAEEMYGGKVDLIEAGAFSDAAASMMIHPSTRDTVDPRFLAKSAFDVVFHGRESHASMRPQLGINALDAAVQAYVNVSTLRQAMYPTDKVHGVITHGGEIPNVIPAHASMQWYVRARTFDRLDDLYGKVLACFEAAALATGCTFDIDKKGHTFADLTSDSVLSDLFAANSAELGRPMRRGIEDDPALAGSTDMGNVSHVVPSIHPMLDIRAAPAVNHQADYAAHTVTPDGERAIRDGALAMAWTIIDLAVGNRWADLGLTAAP